MRSAETPVRESFEQEVFGLTSTAPRRGCRNTSRGIVGSKSSAFRLTACPRRCPCRRSLKDPISVRKTGGGKVRQTPDRVESRPSDSCLCCLLHTAGRQQEFYGWRPRQAPVVTGSAHCGRARARQAQRGLRCRAATRNRPPGRAAMIIAGKGRLCRLAK